MASRGSPPNFEAEYSEYLIHFLMPRLSAFEDFIDFNMKNFETRVNQINADVKDTKEKITRNEIPEEYSDSVLYGHYEEYQLVDTFKQILIDSLAVQLFSIVEMELTNFCNEWALFYGKPEVDASHGIDSIQTYLIDKIKVTKIFKSTDWEFVQNFRTIRKGIVHKGGRIAKPVYLALKNKPFVKSGFVKLNVYDENKYYVHIKNVAFLKDISNTLYQLLQQLAFEAEET